MVQKLHCFSINADGHHGCSILVWTLWQPTLSSRDDLSLCGNSIFCRCCFCFCFGNYFHFSYLKFKRPLEFICFQGRMKVPYHYYITLYRWGIPYANYGIGRSCYSTSSSFGLNISLHYLIFKEEDPIRRAVIKFNNVSAKAVFQTLFHF